LREISKKRILFFLNNYYYRKIARLANTAVDTKRKPGRPPKQAAPPPLPLDQTGRKLPSDRFGKAESFGDRDVFLRDFAAECYDLAKKFSSERDEKLALQYTKLAAKLLGLSMRPKKLSDLDVIKKTLAELKAQEKAE